MQYQITLQNVKPFSINKAHYRSGVRTRENREWSLNIHQQLAKCSRFPIFKKRAKKAAFFHIFLTFNIPKKNFYTKTGKISRLTSDLTNIEKGLVDLIFDKRFNNRKHEGISFISLEVDDCLITKLVSEKRATSDDKYFVDVTILAFS